MLLGYIYLCLFRKLERDRTIVSMSLKEEKEILKQIQKLERTKRQIVDFQAYNEVAQEKKVCIISVAFLWYRYHTILGSLTRSIYMYLTNVSF
jgi:lipid II:glycine glycyltransferase (peptidoglycan interpeptide bridge formation enzyme)